MKKLFLTSLLIATAASGAHAANIIDGNPLYMPKAGHFYSETALSSHSETTEDWKLGEVFGYGVTDQLALSVRTSLAEMESFDNYAWEDFGVKATFRAFQDGNLVADVYGEYAADGYMYAHSDELKPIMNGDDYAWFDKDLINYTWTAGVRGGYVSSLFTVAGHLEYVYTTEESFKWGKDDHMKAHALKLGLDGQLVIDPSWNLVGGVEYTGYTDDDDLVGKNNGIWDGYIGMNYNIDASKFVGAYVKATMDHWEGKAGEVGAEKGWGFKDGFEFGMKFGIDF